MKRMLDLMNFEVIDDVPRLFFDSSIFYGHSTINVTFRRISLNLIGPDSLNLMFHGILLRHQ